jgi:hypothetical protein
VSVVVRIDGDDVCSNTGFNRLAEISRSGAFHSSALQVIERALLADEGPNHALISVIAAVLLDLFATHMDINADDD